MIFQCRVARSMLQKAILGALVAFRALLWKPLGSNFLPDLRLKSQMPVLFDFLCCVVGFVVSCCALDASKPQTALVSAIWGPFVEASWEQFSPKFAPEIADPSAV